MFLKNYVNKLKDDKNDDDDMNKKDNKEDRRILSVKVV